LGAVFSTPSMPKHPKSKKVRLLLAQQIHPHAAGIDISAMEMVVAVPPDQTNEPVRTFGPTTSDLEALRDHLLFHKIKTVAMESTGLYWVPLYDVLEKAGIEVCLVNARHVKNVPGRKTDVVDAQWLQQLHTAGLLRSGFRPPQEIRRLRDLMRERADLMSQSSHQILMMQRCFDQMNILLHRVLSDLDGASGLRIIEAILAGERCPKALEKLRDKSCKTPKAQVIKALTGNWDEDCVARLDRAHKLWLTIRQQMQAVGERIQQVIAALETPLSERGELVSQQSAPAGRTMVLKATKAKAKQSFGKNQLDLDVRGEGVRLFGVDLSVVPGISHAIIALLMSEVGTAAHFKASFGTSKQFASWLGLCPDNRVSGGKILGSKTRHVKHRLAEGFRLGAFGLWRSKSVLGEYCRKMKGRLGKAEGITATAHKLARIAYKMISEGVSYDENFLGEQNPAAVARKLHNVQKRAESLGYQLVKAA
jgi:transposase